MGDRKGRTDEAQVLTSSPPCANLFTDLSNLIKLLQRKRNDEESSLLDILQRSPGGAAGRGKVQMCGPDAERDR